MSRFDNFIDTILGVLVVALLVASLAVGSYVALWQPLGIFGAFLLFGSGALIGVVVTYYFCKGRNTVSL